MKTVYSKQQDEWLCENVAKFTWERLAKEFEREFSVTKNWHTLKSHCTKVLNAAPGLCGLEKGMRTTAAQIGEEYTAPNGYVYVKVSNEQIHRGQKGKSSVNWKEKHIIEWEKHNGELPKAYKVSFLDGDKRNCKIENLIALPNDVQGKLSDFSVRHSESKKTRKIFALNCMFEKALNKISEVQNGDCKYPD